METKSAGLLFGLTFALTLTAACLAEEAHDIRTVNNAQVDLTPVHKWLRTHNGARPLPGWKEIRLLDVVDHLGAQLRCKVGVEGKSREIVLANAEGVELIFNKAAKVAQQKARIAQIEQAQKAANGANYLGRNPDTGNEYYRGTYLTLSRRETDYLKELEADLGGRTPVDFACFTGNKYGALEIWDIGKKKQPQAASSTNFTSSRQPAAR